MCVRRASPRARARGGESDAAQVERPPNTLRVTVIRAKDLQVMDSGVFKSGSSDPFPILEVEGKKVKGTVKKACLAPFDRERSAGLTRTWSAGLPRGGSQEPTAAVGTCLDGAE